MKFHVFNAKKGRSLGVVEAESADDALSRAARTNVQKLDLVAHPCSKFVVERVGSYELVFASSDQYAAEIAGDPRATVWARFDQLYRRSSRARIGEEFYSGDDAPAPVLDLLGSSRNP